MLFCAGLRLATASGTFGKEVRIGDRRSDSWFMPFSRYACKISVLR